MIFYHQNEHRGISHFSVGCNLECWLFGFILWSVSYEPEFGRMWNLQIMVLCFRMTISWIAGEAEPFESDEY